MYNIRLGVRKKNDLFPQTEGTFSMLCDWKSTNLDFHIINVTVYTIFSTRVNAFHSTKTTTY